MRDLSDEPLLPSRLTMLQLAPGQSRRRRRQHRLPAGRIVARDVADAVGVSVRTLLRRVVPPNNAVTVAYWSEVLDIQAVPSRGHFMFTFDAERVHANIAELRDACGRAGLPIEEARRQSRERKDGWGGRHRRQPSPPPTDHARAAL
jgi:hypothetical protein